MGSVGLTRQLTGENYWSMEKVAGGLRPLLEALVWSMRSDHLCSFHLRRTARSGFGLSGVVA